MPSPAIGLRLQGLKEVGPGRIVPRKQRAQIMPLPTGDARVPVACGPRI